MTIDNKRKNGHNGRSDLPLLAKVIAFGYEDGPTYGVAESTDGSSAYRFSLLATDVDGIYDYDAWDRGEELRVYSLAMLPPGSFEQIVTILTRLEHPKWPVWVPGLRHPFSQFDDLVTLEVEPILRLSVGNPFVMVTASLNELPRVVVRPRDLEQSQDWFALLGLEPMAVPT
jgi:hypothetical protein